MISGCNPETILREVLSQRLRGRDGPSVGAHYDARLPERLALAGTEMTALLGELADLLGTLGPAGNGAIAIWLDSDQPPSAPDAAAADPSDAQSPVAAPSTPLPVLIELRGAAPGLQKHTLLAPSPALEAAAAAVGAEMHFQPAPSNSAAGVQVQIRLEAAPAPGARTDILRWADAFRGRRVLILRRPMVDEARLRRSLEAVGLEVAVAAMPDEGLALARDPATRFDFAIVCGTTMGQRFDETVAALAALPEGERPAIALINPRAAQPETIAAADLVVDRQRQWRRLLSVLHDLGETGARGQKDADGRSNIPDFRGSRILIAEDVAMNQALLEAMLAPTGAACTVVGDGAAAVEAIRNDPYHLVLMDIQMPRMDGLEATRQIRALAHPIRIIALTAHASDADRARYLAQDMDGYLAKPIRVDDLYDLLRASLASG